MILKTFCATACLWLGSLAASSSIEAFSQVNLVAPDLSENNAIGTIVSYHDYREDGIRVEPAYIREKLVLHNYGHGGASLSLAWGSAQEAFEYLQIVVLSGEFVFDFGEAAVLGAGVVGLTTANFLLDRGYKVKIYSDAFPPHITNDPLEGLWWPKAVSTGRGWQKKAAFKRILKSSYKHFEELADSSKPEYAGVARRSLYSFNLEHSHHRDVIDELFGIGVYSPVVFDNGALHHGICFDTFHVDPNVYIHSLYEQALKKGAVFVHRSFQSERELEKLDENVIFNCMGKGTKEIFGDDSLSVVRHQSLIFPAQEGVDYMLRSYQPNGKDSITFMSQEGKIILGGIYQFTHFDLSIEDEKAALLEGVRAFFQ